VDWATLLMKKIRISYSLISLWEKGDTQGVIDTYFHVDKKASRQMEEGKKFHQEIADHLTKFNLLPSYIQFGGKFTVPKPEQELIVDYSEIATIKGVIDCLDEPNLYEFKTGVTDSLEWSRTQQIPLYFLICELAKVNVDTAYLIRYNQYAKETDYTIIHNNKRLVEQARNVVDTVSPEIHKFFMDQGLL